MKSTSPPKPNLRPLAYSLALAFAIVVFAYLARASPLFFGAAMGAVGGIIHEFLQTWRQDFFPRKDDDGWYMGALVGSGLGVAAGWLAVFSQTADLSAKSGALAAVVAGFASKSAIEALIGVKPAAAGSDRATSAKRRNRGTEAEPNR